MHTVRSSITAVVLSCMYHDVLLCFHGVLQCIVNQVYDFAEKRLAKGSNSDPTFVCSLGTIEKVKHC